MNYVGRFAPSPTGPLHLGSLVTAVAGYLHARQQNGHWRLRIDDIDPPRIVPGAIDDILSALDAMHLHWDGSVYYQSQHADEHRAAAVKCLESGDAYRCTCSRRQLLKLNPATALGVPYNGHCRNLQLTVDDAAIRLRLENAHIHYVDAVQGTVDADLDNLIGDYVIYRRDGLPAYHLACVIDDAAMAITDVVRGYDLILSSALQIHLARHLACAVPRYLHVPLIVDENGEKLSKYQGLWKLDFSERGQIANTVLRLLGADVPAGLIGAPPHEQWLWAAENWQVESLRGIRQRRLTD